MTNATQIRPERPEDYAAVYEVNRQAFGRREEADAVEAVRRSQHCISLVAERDGQVIGHILFSPVSLKPRGGPLGRVLHIETAMRGVSLGPVAVLPECQRQGVGSQLVTTGLEACRAAGYNAVVVLGHPDFYPRFGFVRASTKGLRCEYDLPDPVFMAAELEPGALDGAGGTIRYAPEFANL